MTLKGISIKEGQAGVLELDGTLVYVESITPVCACVVALPDQPTTRNVTPSFTPGRVGTKKISPFMKFAVEVAPADLTERNQNFVKNYQTWRVEKPEGINFIERTPEEQAAAEAAANVPSKEAQKAQKKREKEEFKEKRKALKVTPRYLQRCVTCKEQPGHPDHGTGDGKHEFVSPPVEAVEASGTEPKAPKPERVKIKNGARTAGVTGGPYKWVGTADQLVVLAGANPKYGEGNSGRFMVDFIGECGEAGATPDQIVTELAQHPRWGKISRERIELAIKQLVSSGLIVTVTP